MRNIIRKYRLIYKLNSIIIFNAYCASIWYSFGNFIIGWIYNTIQNQPLYSIHTFFKHERGLKVFSIMS